MERIDFASALKELPIEKGTLAAQIANIPSDIVLEYIDGLNRCKAQVDENLAILHSGSSSNQSLCLHYLEQLSEERLQNVHDIVELLNDRDLLQQIDRLIELTHQIPLVNEEKKEKANELTEFIKNLDQYKLENVAGACLGMQEEYSKLSKIILFYLEKKRSEIALKEYLNKIDIKALDSMISTCSIMKKVYENIS